MQVSQQLRGEWAAAAAYSGCGPDRKAGAAAMAKRQHKAFQAGDRWRQGRGRRSPYQHLRLCSAVGGAAAAPDRLSNRVSYRGRMSAEVMAGAAWAFIVVGRHQQEWSTP